MNTSAILLPFVLVLAGCAATAVGEAPGTPPTVQRATPRPAIAPDDDLRIARREIVVDVPIDRFVPWLRAAELATILKGTDRIPAVARTELLTPSWSGPGTRRRVVLTDGSTALEEWVADELPERFEYVVWNYTSDAASYVAYGVGRFHLAAEGARTRVTWTYGFAPNGTSRDSS